MRWYGQLAVVAVLGAAGYAGWQAYKTGRLAEVPVVGAYLPKLTGESAEAGRTRQQAPAIVDVDTVKTARIVETHEAVGTARAYESIMVTAKVAGIINELAFQEGQKVKTGDVLARLDGD